MDAKIAEQSRFEDIRSLKGMQFVKETERDHHHHHHQAALSTRISGLPSGGKVIAEYG